MESVTTEGNIKQWVAEYEAINGVTVKIKARKKLSNKMHLAITIDATTPRVPVPVRIHSGNCY